MVPGARTARFREVLREPARRGYAPDHLAYLRSLSHRPPHGVGDSARSPLSSGPAARRPQNPELICSAFLAEDHALHFYILGGPDFIVGPEAPPASRNPLGLIGKVGVETGKKVMEMRRRLREIVAIVGRKAVHPVFGLPGGVARRIGCTGY